MRLICKANGAEIRVGDAVKVGNNSLTRYVAALREPQNDEGAVMLSRHADGRGAMEYEIRVIDGEWVER